MNEFNNLKSKCASLTVKDNNTNTIVTIDNGIKKDYNIQRIAKDEIIITPLNINSIEDRFILRINVTYKEEELIFNHILEYGYYYISVNEGIKYISSMKYETLAEESKPSPTERRGIEVAELQVKSYLKLADTVRKMGLTKLKEIDDKCAW